MSEISIKKAAFINFLSKYSNIFIGIIYNSILARLLSPNDFGIVAVTTVFTTFFQLFADMGIGTGIIQNKRLNEEDINNIFTFSCYMAIFLMMVFCLFSYPLYKFYNDKVYISIGMMLSISLFFNTLNTVPNAILMKQKKFVLVGVRLVVVTIISALLSIFMAIQGFRYYSIIFYSIFIAMFSFFWNYRSVKIKFLWKFEWRSINLIQNYSGFQLAYNIINYFARNTDNLLIGKIMGNSSLAYYDKAYRLMLYPVQNLTNVITPILHPILSEYQNNKEYIYHQYMKIIKILSLLGVFCSVFCFFTAKEIILIVFGDQWSDSIVCFKILSLSVWAQMVTSSTGSIFQSMGNTKLMFKYGSISALSTVIWITIGLFTCNLKYISFFVMIGFNFSFFINFYGLIKKGFNKKFLCFLKRFSPEIIIILIIVISNLMLNKIFFSNLIISFLIKFCYTLLFYIVGLIITKQYKYFLDLIKK